MMDKLKRIPIERNLRALRVHAGISQSQLARLAGLSPSCIAELERGGHEPRFKTICAIGEALAISDISKPVRFQAAHWNELHCSCEIINKILDCRLAAIYYSKCLLCVRLDFLPGDFDEQCMRCRDVRAVSEGK